MLDFSIDREVQNNFVSNLELQNIHALTVSNFIQITNGALKKLGIAYVQGEISECKMYSHLYFKIKDDNASLDCLMFASTLNKINFKPEVGMQVVVRGSSSLYQKNGQFKLIIDNMTLAGRGQIMERLLKLKENLEKEGVFARLQRKIPRFVNRVGIITSKEGRVVHDITSTLLKRNPLIEILIYDAKVQGEDAPLSLINALHLAYEQRLVDVLIIGRGGGSFEDLLPFSDEDVVRTVALSPIPIISAVGHEPDFALTDFAADVRAPTPTAAAQFVSDVTAKNLYDYLSQYLIRIDNAILNHLDSLKMRQESLWHKIEAVGPQKVLQDKRIHIEKLLNRLDASSNRYLRSYKNCLLALQDRISQQNPQFVLKNYVNRLLLVHSKLDFYLQRMLLNTDKRLSDLNTRCHNAMQKQVEICQQQLLKNITTMQLNVQKLWSQCAVNVDNLTLRLNYAIDKKLDATDKQLSNLKTKFIALNPLAILERGYSYTTNVKTNKIVDSNIKVGDKIAVLVAFGKIVATVEDIETKKI